MSRAEPIRKDCDPCKRVGRVRSGCLRCDRTNLFDKLNRLKEEAEELLAEAATLESDLKRYES